LAGSFGLQPLVGKCLAIVSDARFSGKDMPTVVERLLCISGEDSLTIDRKHLSSATMKLPTRLMFLSNELPRLSEASGALAGRFLILMLKKSFYGQECTDLTEQLCGELPGILLWALEGWKRLTARGKFVQPASGAEAIRDIEELASPVRSFARRMCNVGPGFRVATDVLYQAWRVWCECEGWSSASTRASFGRDLAAAFPEVKRRRGTDEERFYEGIGLRENDRYEALNV
jgi:putative DNA primase/helicase